MDLVDKHHYLNRIETEMNVPLESLRNVYLFGSRLYGTAEPDSDWDFLGVVDDVFESGDLIDLGDISLSFFSRSKYEEMLRDHNPVVLLSQYIPDEFVLKKEILFEFTLSVEKMKFAFMSKVQSLWGSARNYFVEGNYLKMKKMIFHAIRYLVFAEQLLEKENVIFDSANHYYYEMLQNERTDWEYFDDLYGGIKNQLISRVFPRHIKSYDFLEGKENEHIEKLNRFIKFPGNFSGVDMIIVDIIRYAVLDEEPFVDNYPSLSDIYLKYKRKYDHFCDQIETTYQQLIIEKDETGAIINMPELYRNINELFSKRQIVLANEMLKQNNPNVRDILKGEKWDKYLKKLFN